MSKQTESPCRCCSCKNSNLLGSFSISNKRGGLHEEKYDFVKASSSRDGRSNWNNLASNPDCDLNNEEEQQLSDAVDKWFMSVLKRQSQQAGKSDTDYTSSTDAPFESDKPNAGVLRNANDILDYEPESEFLRNMRLQCKYLQNCQPNVFSAVDKFINDPSARECQYKCVDAPNPALERKEEIDNALESPSRRQHKFNPQLVNHGNIFQNPPKPFTLSRGCQAGEGLEEISKNYFGNACDRQSEHISRSRKQVIRCRGKRKRKSKSSERCETENEFQASLKKPHENSCERCWRYASPARSPVNKPDQRFDPNFRRGHSCVNLPNGDGDLQVNEESPCRHHHVTCRQRKRTASPSTQRPQSQTNLEQRSQRSQVKVCVEQQPQRTEAENGLEQKLQVGTTFATPLQKPQVRLERPCLKSQIGNYFQQSSQRPPANYTEEVSCCTRQKVQGAARQLTQSPVTSQQSPAALPASHSFTQVKELMHPPQSHLQFDKYSPRAKAFENIEAVKTGLPTSARLLYSDPGCRPRPKSYTPGMSLGNERSIDDLNSEDLFSTSRKLCFEPTNVTSKSLKSSGYKMSPRAKENLSNSSGSPSLCEKCGLYIIPRSPQTKTNLNLTSRPETSKEKSKSPSKAASTGARVSPGKDTRASSPKRPTTGTPKRGKSKSPSPKPTQEVKKSLKQSPQKSKSPKSSSNKSKSPKSSPYKKESPKPGLSGIKSQHAVFKEVLSPNKKKPQSADFQLSQGLSPNCEKMLQAFLKARHPVRECDCYPRVSGLRRTDEDCHMLCCHCNCKENPASWNSNNFDVFSGAQAISEIEQVANDSDETVYADICIGSNNKSPTMRPCNDMPDTQRSAFPESNREKEQTIGCPYRRRAHSSTPPPSLSQNLAVNYTSALRENRLQVPKNGFVSSEPKPKECSPRKYVVLYTTKCKENRRKDDVEVLVEELARSCPYTQDSRTTDITEKMRKILDCPSDSMALRFQKGVSETCRAPRSSRILYF